MSGFEAFIRQLRRWKGVDWFLTRLEAYTALAEQYPWIKTAIRGGLAVMLAAWTVAEQSWWPIAIFVGLGTFVALSLWPANQPVQSSKGGRAPSTSRGYEGDETKAPAVEFWLPGNWENVFRFKNMGDDEKHRAILAEEVHLRVIAKRRMEDVRFEITVRQRRGNHLDILAQIESSKFVGVVPKGLEQDFLIMRRTYSMVSVAHEVLDQENTVTNGQIRVERDITLFPETPKAFPGRMEETYSFEVAVHHDDGPPDKASFSITLDRVRSPPSAECGAG